MTFLSSWFRHAGAQHDTARLGTATCGGLPAQHGAKCLGADAGTMGPQLVSAQEHMGALDTANDCDPLIFDRLRYFSKPSAAAGVQWEFCSQAGPIDSPLAPLSQQMASAIVSPAAGSLPLPAFAQLQTAGCVGEATQQLEVANAQQPAYTDAQGQEEDSWVQMMQQQNLSRATDGLSHPNAWSEAVTEWRDSSRSLSSAASSASSNSSSPDKALSSSGGSSSTLRSLISRSSSTWSISSSGAIGGADGAAGAGGSTGLDSKQACQDWLSSTECPFPVSITHVWQVRVAWAMGAVCGRLCDLMPRCM